MNAKVTGPLKPKPSSAAQAIVTGVALGIIILLLTIPMMRGYTFYREPVDQRFEHAEYGTLRASGLVGQGYGVAGSFLILTNLLYLVRRRLAWLPLGSIAIWLDIHVFTGLGGSILVLYHSAFQLRTPIASVTSISLTVVVVTGLIGRYIYALAPKTGDRTIEERLREVEVSLPTFAASVRDVLAKIPTSELPANASLLRVIATLPRWVYQAGRRRRAVKRVAKADPQFKQVHGTEKAFVRGIVKEIASLSAGELDKVAGASMLRLWRSFHRYMAILMLLSVGVHIGVAWYYGYRWIWSAK
jgi:dihydropyrimidine dehydrogenase (NAD+) subunit PreT